MKFLVTGATGFLGKHLVNRLLTEGHEVTVINQSGKKPIDKAWENVAVIPYQGSYEIFSMIDKVDIVVHLAAFSKLYHTPDDISTLIDSNIKLGAHLLEWMVHADVEKIINISTYFENTNGKSYSPLNFYAATKKMFEDLVVPEFN